MTKDEALDLALEALKELVAQTECRLFAVKNDHFALQNARKAITAIKQARALDKKAENARELGLDYEPVAPVQEDWGPGPHEVHSLPPAAPVQEPDLTEIPMIMTCTKCGAFGEAMLTLETQPAQKPVNVTSKMVQAFLYAAGRHFPWGGSDPAIEDGIKAALEAMPTPPAAQRQWVGLSDLNIDELENEYMKSAQTAHQFLRAIEAKLKEKNT